MGKLLTEDDVRQMFKQKELFDKDSISLPRGTILTPSAKSFLAEHQIKFKSTVLKDGKLRSDNHNSWLDSFTIKQNEIDFQQLDNYRTPFFKLQSALREQALLFLKILKEQDFELNRNLVNNVLELFNTLIVLEPAQLNKLDNLATVDLQINKLKIKCSHGIIIQFMLLSLERVAIQLADCLIVYPDFKQAHFYQLIVNLEDAMQAWVRSILKEGEE